MPLRLVYTILGLLCLIIGLSIASVAFTNTWSWGFDRNAIYQSFIHGRPLNSFLSGDRIISTNNGGLALLFSPLLITAVVLVFYAIWGKSLGDNAKAFLMAIWGGAGIGFPIYAILFVNLLYDSMGVKQAANPAVVMFIPPIIAVILIIYAFLVADNSKRA